MRVRVPATQLAIFEKTKIADLQREVNKFLGEHRNDIIRIDYVADIGFIVALIQYKGIYEYEALE